MLTEDQKKLKESRTVQPCSRKRDRGCPTAASLNPILLSGKRPRSAPQRDGSTVRGSGWWVPMLNLTDLVRYLPDGGTIDSGIADSGRRGLSNMSYSNLGLSCLAECRLVQYWADVQCWEMHYRSYVSLRDLQTPQVSSIIVCLPLTERCRFRYNVVFRLFLSENGA